MPRYNRMRSRGGWTTPITWSYELSPTGCTVGAVSSTLVDTGFKQGLSEVMLDNDYPGWKSRKGKSFIFNDMLKTKSELVCSGSTDYTLTSVNNRCNSPVLKSTNRAYGSLMVAWFGPAVHLTVDGITPTAISNLVAEVWTECLAKRQAGKANLFETFAELEKTIGMLQTPLQNVISTIKTLRRNGRRLRGYEKVAADSKAYIQFASAEWLRFRYGVMPIVSEVENVMKALSKMNSKEPMVYTARAARTISGTKQQTSNNGGSVVSVTATVATSHSVKVRAYYYDRYTRTIWDDFGLNARGLLGLPWELLRYSFVKDWFVNIGNCIYANIPRVTLEGLGGQVVIEENKHTFLVPISTVNVQPLVWTMVGGASDTVRRTDSSVDRYSPDPIAMPAINSDFRFDNFNRVADASALVVQWMSSIGFARH